MPTLAGYLFLAVVLDAWSRRIVGWAFSADLKTRVVLDALDMALAARKPEWPAAGFVDTEIGCFMKPEVAYAAKTVWA